MRLAIAAVLASALGWDVPAIVDIQRSLVLDHRLTPALVTPALVAEVLPAAVSIALLGAIGSVAHRLDPGTLRPGVEPRDRMPVRAIRSRHRTTPPLHFSMEGGRAC